MTLSIGNKVRKMQDDGVTPVANEGHVLFEVVGTGSMMIKDADGTYVNTQTATLKPIE